jgi:hypothetical protein
MRHHRMKVDADYGRGEGLSLPFKPYDHIRDEVRRGGGSRESSNRRHGTAKRGVFFERKMGTDAIVIVSVCLEDSGTDAPRPGPQNMVEAFLVGSSRWAVLYVLPRCVRPGWSIANALCPDPASETIGTIGSPRTLNQRVSQSKTTRLVLSCTPWISCPCQFAARTQPQGQGCH